MSKFSETVAYPCKVFFSNFLLFFSGKVAFSASLGGYGHLGPYNVATTIKYMDVLTNLGNAYKPATGKLQCFIQLLKQFYKWDPFYETAHNSQCCNQTIYFCITCIRKIWKSRPFSHYT